MAYGRLLRPPTPSELRNTPDWAKPLLEAAMAADNQPVTD